MFWLRSCAVGFLAACMGHSLAAGDELLPLQAQAALRRAVDFYAGKVASHGGYVYRYSADLAKREGEGKAGLDTVWVQPPGTPSVGLAYVEAYERTGEKYLLEAALAAGECLLEGQYKSGGWNASIEFAPDQRVRHDYRVDTDKKRRPRNHTSFDDDKTQSALRFLMRLDQALQFENERIHEATKYALEGVLKAQFPNGGWAQVYDGPSDAGQRADLQASYPDDWPRKYPGGDYWVFYTLNDNALADTIEMLLMAERIYREPRYRDAALRGGQFLIHAQMPEPQPAWAQQYNFDMHPVWARKFEPPAISGGESQGVISVLMRLFDETGDRKFLEPIPRALAYLRKSQLPDGRLARFYELKTNRPLYFTKTYELVYDDSDLPTHYGFQVGSKVEQLSRQYEQLSKLPAQDLARRRDRKPEVREVTKSLEDQVRQVIAALDDRGAWVEEGKLRFHGKGDDTTRIIDSATFAKNVDLLSQYLAAAKE
jgi:PelA/Pel-15E family pectate lyase